MNLDEKIASYLGATKTEPARSKLDPYAELIRGLRQRRWTYEKIAHALRVEFGVIVAPSTVFAFVKVRARKKEATASPASTAPAALPAKPTTRKHRFHLDV